MIRRSSSTKLNASNSPDKIPDLTQEPESPSNPSFECNICFETANEPVVTPCGHLYCWSCLYKWMRHRGDSPQCAICKSRVEKSKVIPIYGRGRSNKDDPRKRLPADEHLPPRPQGLRTEIHSAHSHHAAHLSQQQQQRNGVGGGLGGDAATAAFGLYPGQWGNNAPRGMNHPYATNYGGSLSMSTFSLFPSLFGMQIAYPQLAEFPREQRLTPEQENQEQVARIFVLLVVFIICCVVMF